MSVARVRPARSPPRKTHSQRLHLTRGPFFIERGSAVRVRQRASTQALQMGLLCFLFWRVLRAQVRDGCTFPGLAGIRGQTRRRVSPRDTPWGRIEAAYSRESPCIRAYTVALLGKSPDPSLQERGQRRLIGPLWARRDAQRTRTCEPQELPQPVVEGRAEELWVMYGSGEDCALRAETLDEDVADRVQRGRGDLACARWSDVPGALDDQYRKRRLGEGKWHFGLPGRGSRAVVITASRSRSVSSSSGASKPKASRNVEYKRSGYS
jgi:hypothetical protein